MSNKLPAGAAPGKAERTLRLSSAEWQRLDQLAAETNSRESYGCGHDVRETKWSVLVQRIANREFELIERNPYQLPAGLAEQADEIEQQQQEQTHFVTEYPPRHVGSRRIDTARKQVERKMPVKMTQLGMLELEPA
jgi:hypothetical protein